MKVLRIVAKGLPLFKEDFDISFYAQQRVAEDDKEKLFPLFSNIYMNCSNAFIGINAAGKTSALKVILLALHILNSRPINHAETKDILGDTKEAIFDIYFKSIDNDICKLKTTIQSEKNEIGSPTYKITDEQLWVKSYTTSITKKTLTDFSGYQPVYIRDTNEEFLSNDVSIIIAYNKKKNNTLKVISLLSFTNLNLLPSLSEIPLEIISFLDPTIEKLYFDKKENNSLIHLKFKERNEIILNNAIELNQYLSSGTIKGIVVFTVAKEILRSGGYLVVDELENHFNKEIVSTLIRFFMDSRLNKNGGTLIFSTHYPELLDEYDRNDSIHIIRNKNGITIENLSNTLKRNDIKKSDAYQSGYIEGTTPTYNAYIQLKKNFEGSI
ncbi:MAG: ATP/GTP-binding protein [Traorella sp.]